MKESKSTTPPPAELPLFIYEALDSEGKRIKGARNASDEAAIRDGLRELGYTPILIKLHTIPPKPDDIIMLARRVWRFAGRLLIVVFRRD